MLTRFTTSNLLTFCLVFVHNLLSTWPPELSRIYQSFLFSGSFCAWRVQIPQMAFLVSWAPFGNTIFSEEHWAPPAASARQSSLPGSRVSEPLPLQALRLGCLSPAPVVFTLRRSPVQLPHFSKLLISNGNVFPDFPCMLHFISSSHFYLPLRREGTWYNQYLEQQPVEPDAASSSTVQPPQGWTFQSPLDLVVWCILLFFQ